MVGMLIFGVSLSARSFNKNNLFILLGPGFFASSAIGVLHALTYSGMNIIKEYDANLPTQLWVILSFLLAASFLFATLFYKKKFNYFAVLFSFCAAGIIFVAMSLSGAFPDCYISGVGLTPFKRILEFIVIGIYISTLIIQLKLKILGQGLLKRITIFICLLMLSSLCFTLYTDVFGLFNFMGHYIKTIAFLIIYQSLMSDLILVPYQKIKYDSIHNADTGLYNHKYFFDTIKEQNYSNPGIVIADIDGLKLINDTFGYSHGDKLIAAAGEIIRTILPEDSIAAEISGGEFAILIDYAFDDRLNLFNKQMDSKLEEYNEMHPELPLYMTYGFSMSHKKPPDINAVYEEARESLYAKKVLNAKSTRNNLVKILMKTLETKDFTTKEHASRTGELATELGKRLGLSENRISGIELFAEFHDIGKIGISDNILLKPGPLNDDEKLIIQGHSKLGYEIAISSLDLAPISDFILKHHERWDGKGYPIGLSGENIPIECRILAVVDAYDAITNDRPYRKALSNEEAIKELKKNAGTQFDPYVVELFLEIIQ